MKAFAYSKTGTASDVLRIQDFPTPKPNKGQVRVQVRASGINPSDTKRRSGEFPQPFDMQDIIPHSDGAGVIDRIGAGVEECWLGKRVWFHNAQWTSPKGAAGEYVVLPLDYVACLPEQVPFDAGATFGVPLLTAWYAVHACGELRDKTVFISGGAGAVGAYAVQLAKLKGARVITTVSSPEKAKVARSSGADLVVNYTEQNVVEEVLNFTEGAGVAHCIEVNLSANAAQIGAILSSDAHVVTYGSDKASVEIDNIFELFFKRATLSFFLVYDLPTDVIALAKQEINALLLENKLKFHVAKVYEFADIALAHQAVEDGANGNIVLCQCPAQIADYLQQLDKIS